MRDQTNFFDVFSYSFNYWHYDSYMAPQQKDHAEVWPKGWIPEQSPRLIRKTENERHEPLLSAHEGRVLCVPRRINGSLVSDSFALCFVLQLIVPCFAQYSLGHKGLSSGVFSL